MANSAESGIWTGSNRRCPPREGSSSSCPGGATAQKLGPKPVVNFLALVSGQILDGYEQIEVLVEVVLVPQKETDQLPVLFEDLPFRQVQEWIARHSEDLLKNVSIVLSEVGIRERESHLLLSPDNLSRQQLLHRLSENPLVPPISNEISHGQLKGQVNDAEID